MSYISRELNDIVQVSIHVKPVPFRSEPKCDGDGLMVGENGKTPAF